jgi:hypothetical protein
VCLLCGTFCPHSIFMCFVWIWEQTATIFLYSILIDSFYFCSPALLYVFPRLVLSAHSPGISQAQLLSTPQLISRCPHFDQDLPNSKTIHIIIYFVHRDVSTVLLEVKKQQPWIFHRCFSDTKLSDWKCPRRTAGQLHGSAALLPGKEVGVHNSRFGRFGEKEPRTSAGNGAPIFHPIAPISRVSEWSLPCQDLGYCKDLHLTL